VFPRGLRKKKEKMSSSSTFYGEGRLKHKNPTAYKRKKEKIERDQRKQPKRGSCHSRPPRRTWEKKKALLGVGPIERKTDACTASRKKRCRAGEEGAACATFGGLSISQKRKLFHEKKRVIHILKARKHTQRRKRKKGGNANILFRERREG